MAVKTVDPLLFSAYAEVFLSGVLKSAARGSFLCLRRGVSEWSSRASITEIFSLPTQRCFLLHRGHTGSLGLFSAYAEVFLGHPR